MVPEVRVARWPARIALPVRHWLRRQAIAGRARMAGRHAHLRGLATAVHEISGLGVGMLDSQHSTVAFSSAVELLIKKPMVRIWQCPPMIRYHRLFC